MLTMGIDPGLEGGIALLLPSGEAKLATPMPLLAGQVDLFFLAEQFAAWAPTSAALEEVQYRAVQRGVVNMIRNWQRIEDALLLARVPYRIIPPKEWQNRIVPPRLRGKRDQVIDTYCRYALGRWPEAQLIQPGKRKVHDGMAAALCIAEHIAPEFQL